MNVFSITLKNIQAKPLYSVLSIITLSLSITLLLGIKQIELSFKNQIENNLENIDLVIGAKGSPLQLVLASVLHLDNPTGNIFYQEAQKITENSMVKWVIPISYGDNYKGFRIVGSTEKYPELYKAELEQGQFVQKSMEVILGATVAQQLNLKIGDTFLSAHGLLDNDLEVHTEEFTVVGILKPTQKVIDRLIVTRLESIWEVHQHEEHEEEEKHYDEDEHTAHQHSADHQKEITSLLVSLKSKRALLNFPRKINENTNLQAVLPKYELHKLYDYTSVGFKTIAIIGYLILCIASLSIFMSLYKMMKERAFDLAILRTYGATRFQLIKMVVYEALILVFLAFTIGYITIKVGATMFINSQSISVQQNILQDLPLLEVLKIAGLMLIMVFIAVVLTIIPLLKMNISTILSNEK
ncbi:permease [Polaribacter reichenbachii]|uniref:Permease n=1 Tax=Polaribacter reichenbachii TaxID=996801 RepID=A0A1B8U4K3_9FLAO|nr:ABC transporter permease [Polaribacter reichenbachii]APZ48174.1 permease [Polaribacter reichenbachii]AUC20443.1 permease [Polaribacter reichenbachii]OBY66792.1 permease [Polaribacter reichenbachii]